MAVQITYHGSPAASSILKHGFKASPPKGGFSTTWASPFQSGAKAFSSPNPNVAKTYGNVVRTLTPTSNLTSPLGGGITRSNIAFGKEIVSTPSQFNKGMNIASKLGTQYTGPTAGRLAAGQTVTGLGGRIAPSLLGAASRFAGPIGIGIGAAQAGAALGDWAYKNIDPVTEFGDWAGGGIYNLIHGRQIKAREQLMNQLIMNQRKQQIQKYIRQQEAAEAAKKKVITTTPKGPPSITQTGSTGSGRFKDIKTSTLDYGPHTKTKVKVKPKPKPIPDRGRGNGGGGGGQRGSNRGGFTDPGKGSYGPWKADGGLINFYKYGGFLG